MLSFIADAGCATAVLDFTSDFSSLFVGLVGVTVLSAALIVAEALRARPLQQPAVVAPAQSPETTYRRAA
jgi:hypothetical protein